MRTRYHIPYFVVALMSLILAPIWGCVEIDSPNFSTKDYRSLVRFTNLAVGVGTATNIRIDSDTYGSVNFAEAGPYKDIPSGQRYISISYGGVTDTMRKTFETDRKGTLFMVGTASEREYLFLNERYVFESPGAADGALVRFFHASPDVGNVTVSTSVAGRTEQLVTGLGHKKDTGYLKLSPLNYTLSVISGADTLLRNISYQFASNKRYTLVIYDLKSSIKQKRFEDD